MLARAPPSVASFDGELDLTRSQDARTAAMARVPISSLIAPQPPRPPPPQPLPLRLVQLHGRDYWSHLLYPGLRYPFPHDDREHERLDLLHTLVYGLAMGGAFPCAEMMAPAGQPCVLDVGYGTGFWLYDMSQRFPDAHLVGIDIAPPLPRNHNMNLPGADLQFLSPVDFEQDNWGFAPGSFDLIHMSQLCGSVSDWARLCNVALKYLKPGTGRLELIEIDWEPCCDDGSLSDDPNAPFNRWWTTLCRATERLGKPIAYPHHIARSLERTGFEIETNETSRIQSWEDQTWEEPTSKRMAQYYKCAMGNYGRSDDGQLLHSFSGMSMAAFTQVEGWSPEAVERLEQDLYAPVAEGAVHLYHRLRVVTARRLR